MRPAVSRRTPRLATSANSFPPIVQFPVINRVVRLLCVTEAPVQSVSGGNPRARSSRAFRRPFHAGVVPGEMSGLGILSSHRPLLSRFRRPDALLLL